MSKLALYGLMVWMIGSLITIPAAAQVQLRVEPVENESQLPVAVFAFKPNFKTQQELSGYIANLPAMLQAKGYLSASVDSISVNNNITTAYVFLGRQYRWKEAAIDQQDWPLLDQLGYPAGSFKIADVATIEALPRRIIGYYQDNGYPFAKVKWSNIALDGNDITANLSINKGPLYKMDSIGMYGTAKLSQGFLRRYLGVPADGLYRQSVLDNVDKKLSELGYVEQERPWSIAMQQTGYTLNFYLRPKKSNQVDALIGLLPASQQNAGKLLLTVDAKLILQNAFGAGESIDFNWEQIQPKSPRLHLVYDHPYIFNSNAGLGLAFQLYKKDSSYLNVLGDLGLRYRLGNNQSATILFQLQRTNLLDVDTVSIKFSKRLPDIADMSLTNLGLMYSFDNTDYRFNPRKGTDLSVTLSGGKKSIRKNNAITGIKGGSINYGTVYDSIHLQSYQVKLRAVAAHYLTLAKQSVLKTSIEGGWIQTPDLFRNEMFQLGGARLLRGFDEESIFADRFTIATMEYRYLVDLNSYFFGFTDIGWAHFGSHQTSFSHTYAGAGLGMAFRVKQGVFNISYAVGIRDDLKLDLRQSKIHFGYASFF